MKKYRKKPVIIEAIQWTGTNLEEIKSFVGDSLKCDINDTAWQVGKGAPNVDIFIKTLEGDHICTKGDFIIKGVKGEFYPCKPDIFYAIYEESEGTENEQINDAPTADVVEVVRCKDCKFGRKMVDGNYSCTCVVDHRLSRVENDFCSYGEGREK